MADDFVQQIARLLGQSPEETERTLHALADSIRGEVESSGAAEIEGLGVFRREDDSLTFEPDPSLERAVNHRYSGLLPLDSGPDVEPDTEKETDAEKESDTEEEPDAEKPEEFPAPEPPAEASDPFDELAITPLDLPDEQAPEPVRDLASDRPEPPSAGIPEPIEPEPDPEPPEEAPEPVTSETPGDAFDDALGGEMIEEDAYLDETEPDDFPDDAPEADDAEIDALLEGVWMPATGATDTDHPLGPAPPEMMEEADFSVMGEGDEPSEEEQPEEPELAVPPRAEVPEEPGEPDDSEPDLADEAGRPAPPPPAAPPRPEAPTPAPGFAATAASAAVEPSGRGRPSRERRSRAPIFGVIAALVLGTLAIVWFLNREPAVQPVDDPPAPIAADTAEAVPPVTDEAPADTAAIAEAVPEEVEPEPEPPSADPLRSSAGIDPSQGGFAWVVASELSREPAERRAAAFREQGFRAGVVAEEAGGRTRYRVALGQFGSLDEANQYRSNLPAGVPADTWLLRL